MREESYRCALESGININGFQIQPCWGLFLYPHFKFSFLVHFVPRKKSSLVNFRIAKVSQLQGHDESGCASENRWVLWGNENMFLCFHILKHCTIWILLPSKCQPFSWHLAFAVSIEFCFDLCKRDKKNPEYLQTHWPASSISPLALTEMSRLGMDKFQRFLHYVLMIIQMEKRQPVLVL